jgi:hypothetical protein
VAEAPPAHLASISRHEAAGGRRLRTCIRAGGSGKQVGPGNRCWRYIGMGFVLLTILIRYSFHRYPIIGSRADRRLLHFTNSCASRIDRRRANALNLRIGLAAPDENLSAMEGDGNVALVWATIDDGPNHMGVR